MLMLLPNLNNAIIPNSKLRDYCLNKEHRTGKHKAILFESVLGFHKSDYRMLKSIIQKGLAESEAILRNKDRFGERYYVDISLENISSHILRTAWIIKTDEKQPILTTCYLIKSS